MPPANSFPMNNKLPARTSRNLDGVVPHLRQIISREWSEIAAIANSHDAKVEIICGFRSQAEQDSLYAQGRTKPGPKVTWTRNSRHTSGRAVDFGSFDKSGTVYLEEFSPKEARAIYSDIADHLENFGVFRPIPEDDPCHFELAGGLPDDPPAETFGEVVTTNTPPLLALIASIRSILENLVALARDDSAPRN